MNTLQVTYDLSKPGQAYNDLINHLKSYGTWCHALQSTWFIRTSSGPTDVRNKLKAFLDANDKVIVLNVTNDTAAWMGLSDEISNWLRKYL